MSDQVQSRRPAGSTSDAAPLTKSEKRALAKAAAAKAAATKRRRQALSGAFAGLAVVAVIVVAFIMLDNSGSNDPAGTADPSVPSASAPASPGDAAPADAAPSANPAPPALPPGSDPALATKPVTTKGSGALTKLNVKTLIEGKGPATQTGQQVTVNYVGVSYQTGEEFDSSWSQSQPFTLPIGVGQVIPGWDQGLVGVKVGSRVQLDIPSALAYGDNPTNGAPGGPLRFVVDVLAAQ
jgi:peptidylprolyl isomerase